jgi:hypothetical protein
MVTRKRGIPNPHRYTAVHPVGVDAHHSHAPTPGLALVMASQGVTYEALSELSGYPQEYIRKMAEEDQLAPRIVSSKLSAILGVETDDLRAPY